MTEVHQLSSQLSSSTTATTTMFSREGGRPPALPPTLQRHTSTDIEARLNDENVTSNYAKNLQNDDEPFAPMADLRDDHYYYLNPPDGAGESLHMKVILKEMSKILPKQLEVNARGSMFVRYDEDNPQYLRAVLTGIEGTPYASGIFIFDVYLPSDYPNVPCHCKHVTPNAQLVHANNGPGGFSPNLHSDTGQVCLSLLGTWDGPGWESGVSNVYQVLSTILYMILGAKHPYYMEPDYGGWEGTAPTNLDDDPDKELVVEYDEEVKYFNAKLCILAPLLKPPSGFEILVHTHLFEKRKLIMATLRRWAEKGSDDLKCKLNPVISDIHKAFIEHITLRYAEEDLLECKQRVNFIERKMDFLAKKIKNCVDENNEDSTIPGPPCPPCHFAGRESCYCSVAATHLPKAWERYCLGPRLLKLAKKDLEWTDSLVKRFTVC